VKVPQGNQKWLAPGIPPSKYSGCSRGGLQGQISVVNATDQPKGYCAFPSPQDIDTWLRNTWAGPWYRRRQDLSKENSPGSSIADMSASLPLSDSGQRLLSPHLLDGKAQRDRQGAGSTSAQIYSGEETAEGSPADARDHCCL
jgi:hypothetical protein